MTWCDDAGARRDDAEVAERLLAPAQEGVALAVPVVLHLDVVVERDAGAELIDLHGVVDHELGGLQRVDGLGLPAHRLDRFPHRGEIDHCGNAGEVLHQDAGRRERDLARRFGRGVPAGERLDVVRLDRETVLVAEQGLQQDP